MGDLFRNLGYRFGGWPRRLLALSCLLLAALTALSDRRSAASTGPSGPIVVAARDLASGTVLTSQDLTTSSWPAALRPASALRALTPVVGRRLAGPVRAREPITSTRLVGAELTSGLAAGLVATTIPVPNSAAASLLHAGDSVDLFLGPSGLLGPSDSSTDTARLLAASVAVLAVLPAGSSESSASIVVAVDRGAAIAIAGAGDRAILATVRGSP